MEKKRLLSLTSDKPDADAGCAYRYQKRMHVHVQQKFLEAEEKLRGLWSDDDTRVLRQQNKNK
jgi:hypothetical protein